MMYRVTMSTLSSTRICSLFASLYTKIFIYFSCWVNTGTQRITPLDFLMASTSCRLVDYPGVSIMRRVS